MASITLNGREIPLSYKTREMKSLQEEVAPLGRLMNRILGRASDEDNEMSLFCTPEHLDAVAKTVRILGNAWLRREGKEQDLTDDLILDWMETDQVGDAVKACVLTINRANESEIPDNPDDGPVDVTLEQIKKKETKES